MSARPRRGALVAGLVALAYACAPTARTAGAYFAHAADAIDAVESTIESDLVLLRGVSRGHTTAAYVSVATSDAEDVASSAASSFLSIQPPGSRSQRVRARVADVFDEATSVLGDARIAARRGDRDALLAIRPRLRVISVALDHLRTSVE